MVLANSGQESASGSQGPTACDSSGSPATCQPSCPPRSWGFESSDGSPGSARAVLCFALELWAQGPLLVTWNFLPTCPEPAYHHVAFSSDSQKTPLVGPRGDFTGDQGGEEGTWVHVQPCPCPSDAVLPLLWPPPHRREREVTTALRVKSSGSGGRKTHVQILPPIPDYSVTLRNVLDLSVS